MFIIRFLLRILHWHHKLVMTKAIFFIYGIVAIFILIQLEHWQTWYAKDDPMSKDIPSACYVSITDQPLFISFSDYQNQSLKTLDANEVLEGKSGHERWKMFKSDTNYTVRYHDKNQFLKRTEFTYKIVDNRPAPIECLKQSTVVLAFVSLILTGVLMFLLRYFLRRFKTVDVSVDAKQDKIDRLRKGKSKVKQQKKRAKNTKKQQEKAENAMSVKAKEITQKADSKNKSEAMRRTGSAIERK